MNRDEPESSGLGGCLPTRELGRCSCSGLLQGLYVVLELGAVCSCEHRLCLASLHEGKRGLQSTQWTQAQAWWGQFKNIVRGTGLGRMSPRVRPSSSALGSC